MNRKIAKSLGALLLVTAVAVTQVPVSDVEAVATASDFEMDGTKLLKYSGTEEMLSIPDGVKSIGEEAFARNQADQMVYQSEKTLSEMGDKIPADDKNKVQAALDKLKETLKGTDAAAIKADTEALQQAFYAVSEKLYQQANPQGAQQPGPDAGAAQQGQYYDADYKVVDDDDQKK